MEAETSRMLVDQAPDALIFADTGGIVRSWNRAAERVFGHSPNEAIGQTLDLIVPERFRELHWDGYRRAIAEGRTKYDGQALPTRSVRKDGADIYVELTFSIVHDATGQVIGAMAIARDITERWMREREQRQRLRELEQQTEQ